MSESKWASSPSHVAKRPGLMLAEFLEFIGRLEEKVEVTRQILVENPNFDAITAFKRLDYNQDGKITPQCLTLFLDENKIRIKSQCINILFDVIDRDQDGFIDWPEFVKTVITKEKSFNEKANSNLSLNR